MFNSVDFIIALEKLRREQYFSGNVDLFQKPQFIDHNGAIKP